MNIDLNEIPDESDEPFISQTFGSEEEALVFYRNYAERHGFGIRKDRYDKRNNKIVRHDLSCHRGRKKPVKVIDASKEQRKRESSRCECNAHMRITLRRVFEIFPEEWHVSRFVKQHNHELLLPHETRLLPCNRVITPEDEEKILLYKGAGFSVRQIIRVMELEKKVEHGGLPFIEKDIRNLFTKVKKMIAPDDAMDLIESMKLSKEENIKFQYAYTIDEDRRLEHLFWCPVQSFDWYHKYGDVVVFDTTYKVNAYDMPCAIFVGIDNHGNTILFGCALLRNETTSTFRWLMKTFVQALRKPPKTIITDQDPWMSEAIASEMPTTKHSYCIWHITSKFSGWLTALLRSEYQNWCGEFYMLYKLNSPQEFEHNWPLTIKKYNLQNNKHVKGLYQIRHFWASAYLRDYFFGGMTTTGRSESINAFIKRFISSHTSLMDFFKQMDVAIKEIELKRTYNNMMATVRPTSLKTRSPLEEQAFQVLTPFSFKKFQEEIEKASQYSLVHENGKEFILKHYKSNGRMHTVFWDGSITLCNCKNFEFWGILCRHILRVFIQKDCFHIPPCYLSLRWRSDMVESSGEAEELVTEEVLEPNPIQINENLRDGGHVLCPPKSKTKGRPRNIRLKGGKEQAKKQTKSCSICKQSGHTKPTCPLKVNLDQGVFNAFEKRQKVSASDIGLNPIFCLKD